MNKRRKYIGEIILTMICLLLILVIAALVICIWKQRIQFDAEKKQWAEKEIRYEKRIKKLKKQKKGNAVSEGTIAPPQYMEKIDSYQAGQILEPEDLDWEDLSQYFRAYDIVEGDPVYQRINGNSYRENDDIGLEDLAYMKMLHYNFDGEIQVGELIMNKELKEDILQIFRVLFENEYQIESMYLVDKYWIGDGITSDSRSIDHNNTSAFNYRPSTANTAELSNHALGRAIDINPLQNPYIWYEDGIPAESYRGDQYNDREQDDPHIIDHDDLCYQLFTEHGFTWGGDWSNPVDYQHFEKRE